MSLRLESLNQLLKAFSLCYKISFIQYWWNFEVQSFSGLCFFFVAMDVSAKLMKTLSFHLKELKDSTWEGDYDDIGKQHHRLIKDILEDGNFHVPGKLCLGKCILEVFPYTEQVLRDKN